MKRSLTFYERQMTKLGAENRLINLHKLVEIDKDVLTFLWGMENGIKKEKLDNKVKNPKFFQLENGKVHVDRCQVICEIWFNGMMIGKCSALSEGVTTPLSAVNKSLNADLNKTAGSFIGKEFGVNPKDWHGEMAGKSREPILRDAAKIALGVS